MHILGEDENCYARITKRCEESENVKNVSPLNLTGDANRSRLARKSFEERN